jgi:hypothetical protein
MPKTSSNGVVWISETALKARRCAKRMKDGWEPRSVDKRPSRRASRCDGSDWCGKSGLFFEYLS